MYHRIRFWGFFCCCFYLFEAVWTLEHGSSGLRLNDTRWNDHGNEAFSRQMCEVNSWHRNVKDSFSPLSELELFRWAIVAALMKMFVSLLGELWMESWSETIMMRSQKCSNLLLFNTLLTQNSDRSRISWLQVTASSIGSLRHWGIITFSDFSSSWAFCKPLTFLPNCK